MRQSPPSFLLILILAYLPTNLNIFAHAQSTTASSTSSSIASTSSTPPVTTSSGTATGTQTGTGTTTSPNTIQTSNSTAPDVLLHVPELSVGLITLEVDNLVADLNLAAQVANLVTINAGVHVSVQKVNITIKDVEAQVELEVRLGRLVEVVGRVFESLDLNPLLIDVLNDVTQVVTTVIGAVDGLLGSITQGSSILNFVIDSLGNIVQTATSAVGGVAGGLDTIVGNYLTNMTATGVVSSLGNGLTQKQYSYSPLNALVNIVFNAAGQIVGQPSVVKATGSATGTGTSVSVTASATATGAGGVSSTSLAVTSSASVAASSTSGT